MKELKNKEIIAGLIVILILSGIAVFLLVKREQEPNKTVVETQIKETEETVSSEEIATTYEDIVSISEEENSSSSVEEEKQKTNIYSISNEWYTKVNYVKRPVEDGQLEELFGYWDAYNLEAIDELVRLKRVQAISAELDGTNTYYYYGPVNSAGNPHGKGLAVYENNAYYCGEFKDGERSGEGMWLQVFVYKNEGENLGIMEHSYNGSWSKDLPNGEGQEHFSFDYDKVRLDYDIISNVIGNFKDGYYDGEMYIVTTNEYKESSDWYGTANQGVWKGIDGQAINTHIAVWRNERETGIYWWIPTEQNKNYGIYGLKK